MTPTRVELIEVDRLIATEDHGPQRVLWLCQKIVQEGFWTAPIKVEQTEFLVMDGHHRFATAKRLKLKRVPVQFYHYDEVGLYSLRDDIDVSVDIIFNNFAHGKILPYKTAKHRFPDAGIPVEAVPLDRLR